MELKRKSVTAKEESVSNDKRIYASFPYIKGTSELL